MRHAWANVALLGFLALALVTGLLGLLGDDLGGPVVFAGHAVAAWSILVLLLWKGRIVRRALRRPARDDTERAAFLTMLALLGLVLATGTAWLATGYVRVLGVSLVNLHAYLALVLAVLLVWHVVARRRVLRHPRARSRAAFLRLVGVGAAGAVLWQAERAVERAVGADGRRRFTGSYETGSGTGVFPVVYWLDDDPDPVVEDGWRLEVTGAVERPLSLDAAALARLSTTEVDALLDCTGGWYTRQRWRGAALADVLAAAGVRPGARSVRVEGVTGYARRFDLDAVPALLLATAVAGRPLTHGHGAPARLVVPGRRGFEWVKWVVRVEVSSRPAWAQSPLPLS